VQSSAKNSLAILKKKFFAEKSSTFFPQNSISYVHNLFKIKNYFAQHLISQVLAESGKEFHKNCIDLKEPEAYILTYNFNFTCSILPKT
jgi:hypothetical protein